MITLRDLEDSDREAVLALRLAPGQRRFVGTVPESLAEAAEEPGAQAISWAIYRDETPVGFVMIADEVAEPYIPQYLWKLLIDERYQRQGVGTATLDLIVRYFLDRPGVDSITTSAAEGDGSPIPFYERYGFERTGEMHDQEVFLRLYLRKHEASVGPEGGTRNPALRHKGRRSAVAAGERSALSDEGDNDRQGRGGTDDGHDGTKHPPMREDQT